MLLNMINFWKVLIFDPLKLILMVKLILVSNIEGGDSMWELETSESPKVLTVKNSIHSSLSITNRILTGISYSIMLLRTQHIQAVLSLVNIWTLMQIKSQNTSFHKYNIIIIIIITILIYHVHYIYNNILYTDSNI